jgi:hypothetical protein
MRHAERKPQVNQSEYIRNLQQQIYLLELETRYMKTGKSGSKKGYIGSTMSLSPNPEPNLEEDDEQLVALRADFAKKEQVFHSELAELKKVNEELEFQLKEAEAQQIHHSDTLHGDIYTLKSKNQEVVTTNDLLRAQLEKLNGEKIRLDELLLETQSELSRSGQKVKEQLDVNKYLEMTLEKTQMELSSQKVMNQNWESRWKEVDVDGFHQQVRELQQKVGELMAEHSNWELEKQSMKHHQELVKQELIKSIQKTKTLEMELKQVVIKKPNSSDQRVDNREQTILTENKVKMLQIQCETKDDNISVLSAQVVF